MHCEIAGHCECALNAVFGAVPVAAHDDLVVANFGQPLLILDESDQSGGIGEFVFPAKVVPIIHVKGEGNDLIGVETTFWKSAYPVIYWGAAASTFRGIEFQ